MVTLLNGLGVTWPKIDENLKVAVDFMQIIKQSFYPQSASLHKYYENDLRGLEERHR